MAEEYTTKKLGELLDKDQLQVVDKLVTSIRSGLSDVRELRTYLRSQSEVLESRGVVADYLYYTLCYKLKLPL